MSRYLVLLFFIPVLDGICQSEISVRIHDDIYSTNYILPVKVSESAATPFLDNDFYNVNDNLVIEFEDQFNDSSINLIEWDPFSYAQKGLMNYDGDPPGEIQYLSHENVRIVNGAAQIIGREFNQEKLANTWTTEEILEDGLPNKRFYRYSSGQIISKRLVGYGRVEARIRIPQINYIWPALWLFGGEQDSVAELNFGTRRCEIDIFEFAKTGKRKMLSTIHFWNFSKLGHKNYYDGNSYTADNFEFEETWHIYRMDWDQYKLDFYLDDVKLPGTHFHYYALKPGEIPTVSVDGNQNITGQYWGIPLLNGFELLSYSARGFDIYVNRLYPNTAMPLICGMGIQQTNDPPIHYNEENKYKIVNDQSAFPVTMDIDWVRIYSLEKRDKLFSKEELILADSPVVLYPNPATESFRIEYRNGSVIENYKIYDCFGRVIRFAGCGLAICNIDLTGISKGVYTIMVSTNGSQTVRRFVKI